MLILEDAREHAAPRAATATSLVLFVGPGLRPDAALTNTLGRDGMRCHWLCGAEQALQAARMAVFDALVVDSNAAGAATTPTLAQLRQALRCPVVVVAPQADEVDEIVALELGADAFLTRPLAPRRLRAHLAALMRQRWRAPVALPLADRPVAQFAGWALDSLRNTLSGHGRRIELTALQSGLLQGLFDAAGRLVPRSHLIAALPRSEGLAARSIDVYVRRLRLRLREASVHELSIDTVRGRGYQLRVAPRRSLGPAHEMRAA